MRPAIAILVLKATAAAASIFDTILPTDKPTITTDPWRCTTHILESYFDGPKPTGSLLTALLSYGDELQKDCKSTLTDAMGLPVCTFPPQSDWCAFTTHTAAPSALLSEYSSYGSLASSWWAEHSSAAVEFASYCPNRWFKAMTSLPLGAVWLNDTIAFAGCYAAAHETGETKITATPTATTGSGATATGPKATTTDESNGVVGRADGFEMWVIADSIGLAAAVNSVF